MQTLIHSSVCVFVFLQTFLLHQVASRPRLVPLNVPSLENSQAWVEFLLHSSISQSRKWGPKPQLCMQIQLIQSATFHLFILNLKTQWKLRELLFLAFSLLHIPMVDTDRYTDVFFLTLIIMRSLKENSTQNAPRIKASDQNCQQAFFPPDSKFVGPCNQKELSSTW